MRQIIKTANLAIGYKGKAIARNIDLTLEEGMVTALIGRNGVGKSTLIKTLTKLQTAIEGEVTIEGKRLEEYSRKELSTKIAVVTTEQQISGGLKLREMVALGRLPYLGRLGLLKKEDEQIVNDALESLHISHKANSYTAELSDGERQKGMIARGLVQQTPVIIMDEPFSFLDVAARIEILAMIKEIARKQDKAILFSTHEVTQALRMADKLWVFADREGDSVVEEGTPEDTIEKGLIDKLFPGSKVKFDPDIIDFRYTP